MATQDGAQEMVVVFDASGSTVELELAFDAFQALVARRETLCSHAASLVRAAYVQVAAGLAVRAVVFFQFRVDDEGRLDPTFNLPLEYMASNAGLGPDLGLGRIRMASRAQCPVPWHAINLWEPAMVGDAHAAQLVQKAVWRNRLGLKPAPVTKVRRAAVASATQRRKPHEAVQELDEALGATAEIRVAEQQQVGSRFAVGGGGGVEGLQTPVRTTRSRARGAAGDRSSVSSDGGLTPLPEHLRSEMQRQQQSYLDQIKACREEIQKLKSSLRHERERNRRLQQLLRGDV